MDTYRIEFVRFTQQWMVINQANGVAQSAWTNRADATTVAASLNRSAA